MVTVGATTTLSSAARPVPTPLIDTLLALVVVQLKVVDDPSSMVVSAAAKVSTVGTGGGTGLTVIVTLPFAVPLAPVAVNK